MVHRSAIQNLTVAVTSTAGAAAVISLPRSQVEMTDWDRQWQDRITKVVRRGARDLIANDEAEIGEVVRRRLFEDLGDERVRRRVSKACADWCFERTARLPSEWMTVDSATTEAKAREGLRRHFEACYPFHPSALSVFRRKWSALTQFQQTRGTLAMLAQWVSWAARRHFRQARTEALITLGSAPLDVPEFRAVVLGQLGEQRLDVAIAADLAGPTAHAGALDADTRGPLRDIHRRVGSIGAGYLDRHWPPAFKETGAWPLTGLRQSFLNGSLTRLIDPDAVLRRKIVELVESGVFGLASGASPDGRYERLWYAEPVGAEEVAFESGVFLLTKARSEALRAVAPPEPQPAPPPAGTAEPPAAPSPGASRPSEPRSDSSATPARLCVSGTIPPELWNRLGTKVIPKLRAGTRLTVGVEFNVDIPESVAGSLEADLRQVLAELDLEAGVKVERRTMES